MSTSSSSAVAGRASPAVRRPRPRRRLPQWGERSRSGRLAKGQEGRSSWAFARARLWVGLLAAFLFGLVGGVRQLLLVLEVLED